MADRQSGTESDEARSLAEKLLQFKQSLDPHERALFAALMLYVKRDMEESDVQGFDAGELPVDVILTEILPAPFPGDPELGTALGRD